MPVAIKLLISHSFEEDFIAKDRGSVRRGEADTPFAEEV
jgi:hypothetical protein